MDGAGQLGVGRVGPLIEYAAGTMRRSIDTLVLLVCARAERAIANAWSGGASVPRGRELRRLLLRLHGDASGFPGNVDERVATLEAQRRGASQSGPIGLVELSGAAVARPDPLAELAAELGLSAIAADVLLVVAARELPEAGEVAQLYGLLGELIGLERSAPTSEFLVQELLDGTWPRDRVSMELDPIERLLRAGIVRATGTRPFTALSAHPALIERLRGRPSLAIRSDVELVEPGREPADPALVAELGEALARCGPGRLRLDLRGPARLAQVASTLRRGLARVDPRGASAAAIGDLLRHAWFLGRVPAIVGGGGDPPVAAAIADYPGPLIVVADAIS